MSPRRPLVVLAVALLLAACSDATSPIGQLAGEQYALTTVNGRLLPFLMTGTPTGARSEIVAETLAFRGLGQLRRTRTLRSVDAAGTVETVTLQRDTYYRPLEGSIASASSEAGVTVRIGSFFPCPPMLPNASSILCIPWDRADATGGVVHVTSPSHDPMTASRATLRFERTSPDPVLVPVDARRR